MFTVRMHRKGKYWEENLSEESIRMQFGEFILDRLMVTAWPGTELINQPARVFVLEFNKKTVDTLITTEARLDRWRHSHTPPLPEDLCIFKSGDDHPMLITVAHEGFGWFIGDLRPFHGATLAHNVHSEKLFYQGKYFCKRWKKKLVSQR